MSPITDAPHLSAKGGPTIPIVLGPLPVNLNCPHCQQFTTTTVHAISSFKTHLIALLLCTHGCVFCACVPYCNQGCKNRMHFCSHCNSYLGKYSH